MANLRTNNLCGEGGRNAYSGSVFFDGRDDVTTLQVIQAGSNSDFTFGTGDFTIEMWINHGATRSFELLYDGRRDSSSDVAPMIYLVDGVVYYYTAAANRITGSSTLALNTWHHIALERSSGSTKLYVNGIQEGSTYSDSNSYVAKHNRPTIGGEGVDFANNPFNGFISNVRVCKGHAVYGAAFTPPTSELVSHYNTDDDKTVLLCCQDSDNPLQEATGKELLGQGGVYYGKRFSNLATNGDLETGTTTNWSNHGCSTFEISNFSHSGSYSIHAVSDGNGDLIAYTIPVTLDTQRRYKISAYINCVGPGGTSAKAKMKIGSGAGGNENYESQTADVGAGWVYVEWIGLATSDTTHVTFNESSANNVNDWYVDDLKIELWYPEEGVNILANPDFLTGATGWDFSSTPSGEFSIGSNKLSVADNSRTSDAFATQSLFPGNIAEGRYKVTIDYSISSGDFDLGIGNNRLFGIAVTYGGGAGNTSSFTGFIDAGGSSTLFRIVANQHNVGDFFNIQLSRVAEPKAPKVLPPYGVDAGNTFDGAISMNSSSWMYFPTGRTEERGRGRGVLFGGYESPIGYLDDIYYVQIQSMGNAIDFGSLTLSRYSSGGCGSSTRGLCGGGRKSNGDRIDIIESVEIATTSNSVDFGDLTDNRGFCQAGSNQTRGLWIGGSDPSPTYFNIIDFVTIASAGNAQDFGDLTQVGMSAIAVTQSSTRVLAMGGYDGSNSRDIIEFVEIATTGDGTDFGNLTTAKSQGTAVSNGTRAVAIGGVGSPAIVNIMDFVTIATTGNATDFGDTIGTYEHTGSVDNSIRGVICGARTPSYINILESITIATTGNSTDFGDIPRNGIGYIAGTSDSHGGLT